MALRFKPITYIHYHQRPVKGGGGRKKLAYDSLRVKLIHFQVTKKNKKNRKNVKSTFSVWDVFCLAFVEPEANPLRGPFHIPLPRWLVDVEFAFVSIFICM